jgi:hypothetical protein
MKPPAYLAKLVRNEVLHWGVHLSLNPANHPLEEVVREVGAWLRLFHRKAAGPREMRRAKSQGQKP